MRSKMKYQAVDDRTGQVIATFETMEEARRFDEALTDDVWMDIVLEELK